MDFQLSKLRLKHPLSKKLSTARQPILMLSLLCVLCLLPACATTGGIVTTGSSPVESKARCAGWRPIPYTVNGNPAVGETHGDTASTIDRIRVHNQTGVNKHCWGKTPTKKAAS